MLAGTTLALQFAEPRTGAAILPGAQAHMVDDLAAIDREVMAAGVDRLQQPHLAPGQQFAGIEQARLQGLDAVEVERQFAMKVAAGRPVVARQSARAERGERASTSAMLSRVAAATRPTSISFCQRNSARTRGNACCQALPASVSSTWPSPEKPRCASGLTSRVTRPTGKITSQAEAPAVASLQRRSRSARCTSPGKVRRRCRPLIRTAPVAGR
jgi:hypothetical protein